ncbi:MAG: hypothetical protein JWN04_5964, partial [Myxococcaceae bacterium]|nr:hypothetical protein [Myxococcaceae bacterium]
MKQNSPGLRSWAARVSRSLIVVLLLAHDTGCVLPDVTLRESDLSPDSGNARQQNATDDGADASRASGAAGPQQNATDGGPGASPRA